MWHTIRLFAGVLGIFECLSPWEEEEIVGLLLKSGSYTYE
jgi:hypothetical protein